MRKENEARACKTHYQVYVRGFDKPFAIWAETPAEAAVLALVGVERPGRAIFSIAVIFGDILEIYQGSRDVNNATVARMVKGTKASLGDTVINDLDGMSVIT